ncbi:MAG: UDP-N-acetylmuramate--L-alanyl-gamma-D-glutamyl-m eso-2,6-diaminoheptandioate ligase [marine bacterium B5-7]|nr:MAG: UDP-N-acetylmuramate--L-alanyl-gamma-D-glutamyl-m eso-2,6-diaminoheptandioate ligase [marine bacterium B5-7]
MVKVRIKLMTKHIHILGICGTFMAGVAQLAKAQGFIVSGSDENVYPPMSTQLENAGIQLQQGYDPAQLVDSIDTVIVGNVISRGNVALEAALNRKMSVISGPQWLYENILRDQHVLAVVGTHGKTTTSSMLAWILEHAGLEPGFLIGGVPENFGYSARIGAGKYFVIEADEYDSAFFDKRSKCVHYHPDTLILNNLEFDHADIFDDLAAIQKQLHHCVRTVPSEGHIVQSLDDRNLKAVIDMGCWTPVSTFSETQAADWSCVMKQADGQVFDVLHEGKAYPVQWPLMGQHNVHNAIAAVAAAYHVGVSPAVACAGLSTFKNVKRRMEIREVINDITIYDDFAHHPTAIETTLAGLRAHVGNARILAVLELGSYTMRNNVHEEKTFAALQAADHVFILQPNAWQAEQYADSIGKPMQVADSVDALIAAIVEEAKPHDQLLVMSNTGFQGFYDKLSRALHHRQESV